jgi:predicted component of type VI protein secretion system
MTVKEIASFCGKNQTTITRWVKKAQMQNAFSQTKNALTKGHETDFNIDEVEAILNASTLSKDAVAILMNNARNGNVCQSNVNRDLAPISKMQNYLSPREIEIITSVVSLAVSKTIERLETRITSLEKTVGEQKQLPWNNEIDIRTRINVLVRKFAAERNLDIKEVWLKLYKLFGYKTHTTGE